LWGATLVCILLQFAAVYVPALSAVLRTVPLTAADWGVIALCSLMPVAVVEVVKLGSRVRAHGPLEPRGRDLAPSLRVAQD
jgi:magnesium-transporting ATPase (P-type)